jgi:hypothetical protein
MDAVGGVFIGLALLFLVVMLWGHRKREHLSVQASPWDSIRVQIETELAKRVDFDLGKFRSSVLIQEAFFDTEAGALALHEKALNVPMSAPTVAQVKDTNKLFDEKIRILTEELHTEGKKGATDLQYAYTLALAIGTLKTLARSYMIEMAIKNGTAPKSHDISTSISASIANLTLS